MRMRLNVPECKAPSDYGRFRGRDRVAPLFPDRSSQTYLRTPREGDPLRKRALAQAQESISQ
jgi:hypothetical protein